MTTKRVGSNECTITNRILSLHHDLAMSSISIRLLDLNAPFLGFLSHLSCLRVWYQCLIPVLLDSSDNIRVLKDVWPESDRLEEHKIRETILADAKALREEYSYDVQLEKRMLRPMAYCRVRVGGEEDDTGSVMLRNFDLSKAQMVYLITPKAPSPVEKQSVCLLIRTLFHTPQPLLDFARILTAYNNPTTFILDKGC
ncbi:hypothetical protein DFH05DRAFT_477617 [Lentinula detonsa]|uniref:Uncharacterized protein n=1 Tax=Lentinula detonsa TaxID=2804962 RepID=A0A9W8NSR5_9AGAR|nr:hypothetical protein DFH05DRAFT_477617 [Lentinula detonsa]